MSEVLGVPASAELSKHPLCDASPEAKRHGECGPLAWRSDVTGKTTFPLRLRCGPMLTIGGRGLKGATERAQNRPLQPFRLRCQRVGPEAEVLVGAGLCNGLLSSEQKICYPESEVEGASARGRGPSDGEFCGMSKEGVEGWVMGDREVSGRGSRGSLVNKVMGAKQDWMGLIKLWLLHIFQHSDLPLRVHAHPSGPSLDAPRSSLCSIPLPKPRGGDLVWMLRPKWTCTPAPEGLFPASGQGGPGEVSRRKERHLRGLTWPRASPRVGDLGGGVGAGSEGDGGKM